MKILQIIRSTGFRSRASCFIKADSSKAIAANNVNTFVISSVVPARESRYVFTGQILFPKYLHMSAVEGSQQNDSSKEHEVCVYVAPLKKQVKLIKLFSLSTSAIGVCMFPFVMYQLQMNAVATIATGLISSVFLATPLFLHYITKRYVVELIFNPESRIFTAKTLSLLARVRELKFTADDVHEPSVPGFLSSFNAKGIPLFVDAQLVKDPDVYSHMMGYDKPLDLLIHTEEKENVKPEKSEKAEQMN